MALLMKLKYVQELSGGRKRFRRRYPKAVALALGENYFQEPMQARSGADLVVEWEKLCGDFEKAVAEAKRKAAGSPGLTKRERWREAVQEANSLCDGVIGFDTYEEARSVVEDDLMRRNADPLLIRAVQDPHNRTESNPKPPVTLLDAKKMYFAERMNEGSGRNQRNRLERVCRRIEAALGPLDDLPLSQLRREHGRKLRDHMLSATKRSDGQLLAPSSVRRELDMVRAIVSVGLREFDLKGQVANPFDGLDLPKQDAAPDNEWERRDPLPKDVLLAMRERMNGKLRVPELGRIWRLLEGTGCRGAEVVGLRVEDVKLDAKYPHIWVRWHEERRLKTSVSIRAVPLVGDALKAAHEAVTAAGGDKMLFSRYASEAGPDAVSQALMKHLRRVTQNKRHVVYSLRHNMKDWLVSAGVPERDEHRILGHSLGGVGDRVYGGGEARLRAALEAMKEAHKQAP
jgi:integrase